jgi:primase-polymerase (primpol)-like protein
MMQASPVIDAPSIENIPEQLTERPQWVCWRLEERDGKKTKVPYTPGKAPERRASSTDLMTWRTFSQALRAYERSEPPCDGIGFVFCSADPYSGIDIDHCRNPETGEVAEWAQKIINSASEGYVEVSPSGTGLHLNLRGVVRGGSVKKGRVEMYSRERFFTITGWAL